ncbi:DUF3558 family protein [Rhodococcus sp. 3Y1]
MKFEGAVKRIRIGLALAGSLVLLTGCGSVVTGTPRAEGSYGGSDSQEFANVLQECEAVTDEQIAGAVGADAVGRGFFGAICRWDGIGTAGPIKITSTGSRRAPSITSALHSSTWDTWWRKSTSTAVAGTRFASRPIRRAAG